VKTLGVHFFAAPCTAYLEGKKLEEAEAKQKRKQRKKQLLQPEDKHRRTLKKVSGVFRRSG